MPNSRFYAAADSDLLKWLDNFNTVATNNLAALGMTAAELAPCVNQTSTMADNVSAFVAAQAAAKAATRAKTDSRQTVAQTAIALTRRLQAASGVPDSLKLQLGLTVPKPRRHTIPLYVPQAVVARILPTLQIELTWTPGGNSKRTVYVVEKRMGTASAWTSETITTTTRFVDSNCAPGTPTLYRVTAQRTGRTSAPSASAVVYSGGTSNFLETQGSLSLAPPTQIAA